jgi:hypothetical protein
MAEYLLTPEKKKPPAGTWLMDELHRRGFPVEIHLKGEDRDWETIRFCEEGPPEAECLLAVEGPSGRYRISVSRDASLRAQNLQMFLVDTLLGEVGGQVNNSDTLERFTPGQFNVKLKTIHNPMGKANDLVWIGFSWAVVAVGFIALFVGPSHSRLIVAFVLAFSSLSAAGLTYFHFKHE